MAKVWGFIGCGNLVQAIIEGSLKLNSLNSAQIIAADLDQTKLKSFCRRTGISAAGNIEELFSKADVIVIGTKPQDILPVLEFLSAAAPLNRAIISLAAGVSDKFLQKYLASYTTVARVMANTPALVQRGLFGIYFLRGKNPRDSQSEDEIIGLFKSLGETVLVKKNEHIDALTSASASGVGFVLSFMEEYEGWLVKRGFTAGDSRKISTEVFLGSAILAKERQNLSLRALREAVSSKKGTTLAGLAAMKKAKVAAGLKAGLHGGLKRAVEISKDLLRGKK